MTVSTFRLRRRALRHDRWFKLQFGPYCSAHFGGWPRSIVIKNFKDRLTEAVYQGESPKGFPASLVRTARRKLGYLDAAVDLNDLRSPPGNRLEALRGDRNGQHSIRVNESVSGVLHLD